MKKVKRILLKIVIFTAVKSCCILHRHDFVMRVSLTEIGVTVAVPLRLILSVANTTDVGDVFPTVAPNVMVWLEASIAEGWSLLGVNMACIWMMSSPAPW